jgi:cell division protein FtsN
MVDYSSDPGYELVLDNRRLIIAFVVLILICGCFFVVGFVEGKRQGYQAGSQTAAESSADQFPDTPKETEAIEAAGANPETPPVKEDAERQQLSWYKNVSGQEQKREITRPTAEPPPAPQKEPTKSAAVSPASTVPATAAASGYTVQVGAFRQRQQVEAKAKELRSKGYDCRIEVPQSSEDLYLLKVGRFKSRAEAAAMQLQLKKSGFSSFIKTN